MLQDIVYMIIRPSGEVMEISCNNKYVNHYQYLQDFSKRNPYLIRNSFGLTFSRDDDTSKFFFFNMLIQDGNIIYENIDDLKQGSKLLMNYVDESLKGENSMGGR